MIEPDIDAYGVFARASALADFLELSAMAGRVFTKSALGDYIDDRFWTNKRRGLVLGAGEDDDEDAENYADAAFSCLDERSDVLGALYPFDVSETSLEVKPAFDLQASVYVSLLCLTVAHAYRVNFGSDATQVFEGILDRYFVGLGLASFSVGTVSRQMGLNFSETLIELGKQLNLRPSLQSAARHRYANDAGVDQVAILGPSDTRPGTWILLGQATCGKSESWPAKISEPSPHMWKSILQELVEPTAFLAVPHHVEPRHLQLLSQDANRMVIDRLRLAAAAIPLTDVEAKVYSSVIAEELARAVA